VVATIHVKPRFLLVQRLKISGLRNAPNRELVKLFIVGSISHIGVLQEGRSIEMPQCGVHNLSWNHDWLVVRPRRVN